MNNLAAYKAQMEANIKKVYAACEKIADETLKEMYKKIVDRTPIGNPALWKHPYPPAGYVPGKLKASWQLSFNSTARDKTSGRFVSTKGISNSGAGGIKINVSGKDSTATISNFQPYAYRIEYGSWSTQAPAGMMRITVAEYASIINAKTAQYKIR